MFIWKNKHRSIINEFGENKRNERLSYPDIYVYYKATIIKLAQYLSQTRLSIKQNTQLDPSIDFVQAQHGV
jgi:hypothetical protein